MINEKTINGILNVKEAYQAPSKMLELMLDDSQRNGIFDQFLEHEQDMSYEWFGKYFEDEHSDRKVKKQDFTPDSISKLMVSLTGVSDSYYEPAAGNGGILIKHWDAQRKKESPLFYDPRKHWHTLEEMSDRSLPFLIFNMSIRGMNGVVLHGDSLTRKFKDVYFIRNNSNNFLGYSEVIKSPRVDSLKEMWDIREWEN